MVAMSSSNDELERVRAAMERIDSVFCDAFDTNHPAMHDYATIKMHIKALESRLTAAEERERAMRVQFKRAVRFATKFDHVFIETYKGEWAAILYRVIGGDDDNPDPGLVYCRFPTIEECDAYLESKRDRLAAIDAADAAGGATED